MRHKLRSVVVAGTSALLLAAGTGTASAQGSLEFALPLPIDIPGLSSLAADAGLTPAPDAGAGAGAATATAHGDPVFAMPAEWGKMAFQGRVVAGLNEARAAEGADRLVTDPAIADRASEHADELAMCENATDDPAVPDEAAPHLRTALELPADATPKDVVAAMDADTDLRERMLDHEAARVGVGLAAAEDDVIHVVVDFEA